MGVKFNNRNLKTSGLLKVKRKFPPIGKMLFESTDISKQFSNYSLSTNQSINNVQVEIAEQPTTNEYFDNGLAVNKYSVSTNQSINNVEVEIVEQPSTNEYFDNGLAVNKYSISTDQSINNVEVEIAEQPTTNEYFDNGIQVAS